MGKMWKLSYFIFLCSKINIDGDCSHKMKRCLLLGRKTMTGSLGEEPVHQSLSEFCQQSSPSVWLLPYRHSCAAYYRVAWLPGLSSCTRERQQGMETENAGRLLQKEGKENPEQQNQKRQWSPQNLLRPKNLASPQSQKKSKKKLQTHFKWKEKWTVSMVFQKLNFWPRLYQTFWPSIWTL